MRKTQLDNAPAGFFLAQDSRASTTSSFDFFSRLVKVFNQMRVKRLEIQGFKSFKDKTVIHFDHSITGIVGPNGCGKSNIVDAFFWVMGEQSYKHMRGSSSEDLIFNGSSKYSPVGLAEATLVMETDVEGSEPPAGATIHDVPIQLKTKEISVTRRLYRTGEGEYFINGTHARLKDIQELFMDTGVGAKGYSVIEQGQIGKIVNAKPEERRLLIEEAAGIAKYKARKKESLRKMEATQANLARLADIIQEIERGLDSLERQAQKARLYRKYKDELFEKEITWGKRKSRLIHEKLEALKKQRETLEQELVALRAELQGAENTIEVDRIHLVTETKEAEDLQSIIQQLADTFSQEKSSLELSRRRQGDLSAQLSALETEKQELESAIQTGSERLVENQTTAESAQKQYEEMVRQSQALFQVLNTARSEMDKVRAQLDSHQRDVKQVVAEISQLTSKSSALQGTATSAQAHAERLEEQSQSQQEKLAEVLLELDNAKLEAATLKEKKEKSVEEKQRITGLKRAAEDQLRETEKARTLSLANFTQISSKLKSLEELDASHEGLGDAPRAALEWAKSQGKQDQIRAITDVLSISAGYEVALQSWLENRLENLIASDGSLALDQILSARSEKRGRIAFQLLSHSDKAANALPGFKSVEKQLKDSGFEVLGELKDFVRISPEFKATEYSSAAEAGFEGVCVVANSEPMQAFLQGNSVSTLKGWAIVCLSDGVVLESGGLLRGGSLDASGALSVLRRKHQIEELRKETAAAEAQLKSAEATVAEAKQKLDSLGAELTLIQAETQALEIQGAALARDVHQTEKASQEARSQLQRLNSELEAVRAEAEQALADQEELEIQQRELNLRRCELEEITTGAEGDLSKQTSEVKAQEEEWHKIRIQEASLQERAHGLTRELEAGKSLLSDRTRRLAEIKRTLERASTEKEKFSGDEGLLSRKIEELTLSLSDKRSQLALVKDRIEQTNSRVNNALEKVKESHKQGDVKNSESTQLALEIEKLSGELSHLTLNLEEKYGPGCLNQVTTLTAQEEMGDPIITQEISSEEELKLGEEVERLRERIRRLGEVNVMAIEEFEQLKKRHDHLLQEKADLEKSLENLREAIEHINKTSEDRFKKAFESIADRFERLFPIIFGGGQAKLSLVFPEGSTDILEAGVDILAQPPGKKVVNITLLSGGEKALTAVSLIFAIFMVKPSPFCVLDEVDAPLDDANIGKFNALLREMSAKSQFILITHNKKTMELNDTLYGVTMEEPGVSKMVSIEMH